MLRITPSTNAAGAKKYFDAALRTGDYYVSLEETPGIWGGKAAQMLGLSGEVKREDFFALLDNRKPNGERLTARTDIKRRAGYDFTFSLPKSASVLYEMTGDERIMDAFKASVDETMRDIEAEMKTRVRGRGANEDRLTSNGAWATFIHRTARPVDGVVTPHTHAHVYVMNATWDGVEERFKAAQLGQIKADGQWWEASVDARMAARLNQLSYPIERKGYSFEVAGVPESVIDRFSARRNQIEAIAAAKGVTSVAGKKTITTRSRGKKQPGQAMDQLRSEWAAALSKDERQAMTVVMSGRAKAAPAPSPADSVSHALDHSFERQSALDEKRIKTTALRHGVGSVLPEQVNAEMAKRADIVRADRSGQTMVTTREVLAEEVKMLRLARRGHGRHEPLAAKQSLPNDLSDEQREAAMHILQSRDGVTGLHGSAGTGKTFLMKATINAIEAAKEGRRVHVFAPTTQARDVLKGEGLGNAGTLQLFLTSEKLQSETKGQVLWVDEAGLISSRSMKRLLDIADRNGNRVVLGGDYLQLPSIERGDALRLLESQGGVKLASLKEIRRQRPDDYRKAVEQLSQGTPQGLRKGFDALDRMGAVVEGQGEERQRMLVADYLAAADEKKSALIVAPTHQEGQQITEKLRAALREKGQLGKREHTLQTRVATGWTDAEKRDPQGYRPGMVVGFHQHVGGVRQRSNGTRATTGGFVKGETAVVAGVKDGAVSVVRQNGTTAALPLDRAQHFEVYRVRELKVAKGERLRFTKNGHVRTRSGAEQRVSNGDIVTVKSFTGDGDLRLSNGSVLPKGYAHLAPGYTDTAFAAQGKSVDRVLIAMGDVSLPAIHGQQWYVAASRGRDSAKVYVEDKATVREAIAKTGERLSAVEMVQRPKAPSRWRTVPRRPASPESSHRPDSARGQSARQQHNRSLTHG